ncbi:hypothetical protein A1O1_02937 [Capronia coronata CBS 617.96]|uniref:GDP/GTP exchange factor Sec2 N-terminal domain-containing protein n=1 Tax=Capronia coronata CBS 617.96 TaxID=1182541 RepID=W9YZ27_9EURO|nr:uncharacterized protein A1O1_02937 [Capronia coronata CBS 617.96]EXJ94541.1 hypothetical protein A1O1_02937 [Capronia coronata CBS 617.96]
MATSTLLLNSKAMAPSFDTSTTTSYANAAALASSSCPSCGYHLPFPIDASTEATEAHRRILDLESQVKLLNSKAAAAVDKLADYEDEIRHLREAYGRSQQQQQTQVPATSTPPLEGPGPAVAPTAAGQHAPSRLASLSAFLPGRRKDSSSGNLPVTPATGTFPQPNMLSPPKTSFSSLKLSAPTLQSTRSDNQVVTMSSLQNSLEEERTLRLRAETNLSETQMELEDLTAQLFGEANEMVATERKARAKLEERVKVLEQRDGDKRRRLDRLEKAVMRIERVRAMVGD